MFGAQHPLTVKRWKEDARKLKSKLNRSVSICEDFYEFACGSFRPEIPSDKPVVNEFSIIEDEINEELNRIYRSPYNEKDPNHKKNMKTYYSNCMDRSEFSLIEFNTVQLTFVLLNRNN